MVAIKSNREKMEELRKACETKISSHQHNLDNFISLFRKSLLSLRSNSHQSSLDQVKLEKLKAELIELEDGLVRTLTEKAKKEAKRMAVADSLSETKIKIDELQKIVQDQASRKDEYAAILSQQSEALAESEVKCRESVKHREELQDACTWYNQVLGFHIEGGHGVKFTFTKIDRNCPTKEYSFTIRHANNEYILIHCDPHLKQTEEAVKELNKTNGLFKFVRIMREKFQAVTSGSISHFKDQDHACTSISTSAPTSSVSVDSRNQSPLPLQEVNRDVTQINRRKGLKSPLLSPISSSSHRRSPRIAANKQRKC